jgi:hypothetical protein
MPDSVGGLGHQKCSASNRADHLQPVARQFRWCLDTWIRRETSRLRSTLPIVRWRVVEFRSNELDIVALLQAATINVLLAFLVCMHQTLVTVSPAVMTHIRQAVPGVLEEGVSISYMNGNEAIRQAMNNHDTFMTLLQNDALQTLLKEEANQDLIRIMWHLVIAGSRSNDVNVNDDDDDDDDASTIEDHVRVLETVSDHPDCLYLHLRNHLFSLLPEQDEAVV